MKKLLKDIAENNILLEVVDGELKVFTDQSNPSPELIAEIKEKKDELLQFLINSKQPKGKDLVSGEIPVAAAAESYPLSSSQRRLWLLSQLKEANIAYNIQETYFFENPLEITSLEYAFNELIKRHEILRTVFKEDNEGNVRQFIQPENEVNFKVAYYDLRHNSDPDKALEKSVFEASLKPFDLSSGPLVTAGVYQLSDHKWAFTYMMHHIISDAWSMNIIIKELLLLYNAHVKGEANPFAPLRIQYKDYTAWQKDQLNEDMLTGQRSYWMQQLAGELPVLNLPGAKARPAIKTYNGGRVSRVIDPLLCKGLKAVSQEKKCTLFMGLLATVNALLYRYTGQEDILIGTPMTSREHDDLEGQIGFFVNTLALRTQFKGEDSFRDLLEKTREITLGAYDHMMYPFDELLDDLSFQGDKSRSSLFDVMVVLQNAHQNAAGGSGELEGLHVSRFHADGQVVSKLDLSFGFGESGDKIQVDIEYNSDIYDREMVERLADHLVQLLQALVGQPGVSIGKLDYLHKEEKQLLTEVFNRPGWSYPEKTLVQLLEEQVLRTPDAIAVVSGEREVTYAELDAQANRLGNYLRRKYAIKANELVGIKLERTEWMVIAMLGVLKAGGAYVPMDPEYPQERIDYMLEDSACRVLLGEKELERYRQEQENEEAGELPSINQPADLAYVIYTSGSTGKPKGVMIEHRNASAFIHWCKQEFETSGFDTVLGVTSICFDLSVFEIFYTLSAGKKLRLLPNALAVMPYLQTEEKLLLNTVPSVVGGLLEDKADLSAVKVLNMAGEPIPVHYLQHLDVEKMEVRNLYGPTEDTTYSTLYRIGKDRQVLIGRPIANTEIYILNEQQGLQPVGVTGEIYLAGAGVARGYLNKPELTSERFLPHPWRPAERVYRTGDLARWLTDGTIEYLGRKDDQVKIRGYRIELGEIEHALRSYAGVSDAVVLARESESGQKELVAYVEGKDGLPAADLRANLGHLLPAYMVPAYFVQMDKFPLTASGKVDKKALPDPKEVGADSGMNYKAPRNETDKKLASIWKELLGKEKIGISDDFFEIGGHSMKVMKLVANIHKEFGIKFKLGELFNKTTIEEISNEITKRMEAVVNKESLIGE